MKQDFAASRNYYVATTGSDAAAGTLAAPFATIQKAGDLVAPGDTVLIKSGHYSGTSILDYSAVLVLTASGTQDHPITFTHYGNDEVILDAQAQQKYAVRLGDVFGKAPPIANVVLDGLKFTGAYYHGVYVYEPANSILIQNCESYHNNLNWLVNGNTYDAGIFVVGGQYVTIQDCRVYNNGYGILFSEVDQSASNPQGSKYCTIRDNFVYGNSYSSNFDDSGGIAMRFGEHSTIEGNILWDNPDGGIVCLALTNSRVVRNACLHHWQSPGNREGIKVGTRGGGANLIAFNICARNGQRGIDTDCGIGDVILNNTLYNNGMWGLLAESYQSIVINDIAFLNFATSNDPNKDLLPNSTTAMYGGSDYNFFGSAVSLPTLIYGYVQNHSYYGNPLLADPAKQYPETDPQQIVTPEQLFTDANGDGHVTMDEARAELVRRFALSPTSSAMNGTSLANAQTIVAGAVPAVISALQAHIAVWQGTGVLQWEQGANMYSRIVTNLGGADRANYSDFSGLKDFGGNALSIDTTLHMGAVQQP